MKRFSYLLLIGILSACVFISGIFNTQGMSSKVYAYTGILASNTQGINKNSSRSLVPEDSNIAPIRKKTSKTPILPKVVPPKPLIDLNKIKNSGIINIVFFGLDGGSIKGYSRSDSIMVISIDAARNKLKVTSLMRDMYIPIPNKGKNRINAAYAFGGPSLAIKTINTNFGLNIEDYVTVDFRGLEKLIDHLGGVSIKLSKEEANSLNTSEMEVTGLSEDKIKKVASGVQNLSGQQAVRYCRIRYVGRADYERTERQRRVLNEILKKLKKDGITKLPKTISTVLPYVKTSLTPAEVLKLGIKGIGLKTESIVQYRLPVDGTYKSQNINGMAVLVPNIEENKYKLYEFIYK